MTWPELEHMAREIGKGRQWQFMDMVGRWSGGYHGEEGVELLLKLISGGNLVRLAPQKKLVAWEHNTEFPEGAYYRKRFWVTEELRPLIRQRTYSLVDLCESCEYTTDLKTWHPCGKWVESEEL